MKKLQEKIMRASFGKLLKRWVIAALCVTLLGGGVSAALLSPQIRETITAVQTIHQQKDQWEHDFPGDGHDREEENRERFEAEDVFRASITRPSTAAFISMSVTALLCGLLALSCWLLVAAPLNAPGSCSWRRAVCSMFSPPLFGFAMHTNAGAFRTGFSLAARRSRKSTGFCIFRQTTLYEQLISVCPDYAKCTASRYISIPLYKNLYLFVQQKKPLDQRLFSFW